MMMMGLDRCEYTVTTRVADEEREREGGRHHLGDCHPQLGFEGVHEEHADSVGVEHLVGGLDNTVD